MDAGTITIIVAAIALVVVLAVAYMSSRKRTSDALHERFGSEYDQTVAETGERSKAEARLKERVARVERLDIRPLSREKREVYAERWNRVQGHFVDEPEEAVIEADSLIQEVMGARGYPIANFEQRAADISVDHPEVTSNYREAHGTYVRARQHEASTDELRAGFVAYRALFEELLEPPGATEPSSTPRPVHT